MSFNQSGGMGGKSIKISKIFASIFHCDFSVFFFSEPSQSQFLLCQSLAAPPGSAVNVLRIQLKYFCFRFSIRISPYCWQVPQSVTTLRYPSLYNLNLRHKSTITDHHSNIWTVNNKQKVPRSANITQLDEPKEFLSDLEIIDMFSPSCNLSSPSTVSFSHCYFFVNFSIKYSNQVYLRMLYFIKKPEFL